MAKRPPAPTQTFAPPEDVLGQVVALQQAERARCWPRSTCSWPMRSGPHPRGGPRRREGAL